MPGKKDLLKRYYYWKYPKLFNGKLENIAIGGKISIESKDLITIGRGLYFGSNFFVMNRGMLKIGDNVIFGPNVTIIDYNHDFTSQEFIPYSSDDIVKPVTIESSVWIGYGVIILPGTYIEEGVIVAAGSVIRGHLEKNTIYGGNPAKKIGTRMRTKNQKYYMFKKLGLSQ